jgi:hypothetical protein
MLTTGQSADRYSCPATHWALLSTHHSLFKPLCSPIIGHYSILTSYCSPFALILYTSMIIGHDSFFSTHYSGPRLLLTAA